MSIAPNPLAPAIGEGVYTLPDAALILRLPLPRLRHWVGGYFAASEAGGDGFLATWGSGRGRGFNFLVLIEAYTVYNLRRLGVSLQRIRVAREILSKHLQTPHPFAARGILASGGQVLFDLEETAPGALLQLSRGKQTELKEIIEPFCTRLDFDQSTKLAERFWPCGRETRIVVDPRRAFGRPIINGTSITAEVLAALVDAGETPADVAAQYDVPALAVEEAHHFIHAQAA